MGKKPSFERSLFLSLLFSVLLEGCDGGSGSSSDTSQTSASDVAIVLEAAADSATAVRMSWAASGATVAGYRIYRDGELLDTAHDDSGKTHDTGLTPGSRYCYRVTAVDAAGAGIADSNQSCATTAALAGWDIRQIAAAPPVSLAVDTEGRERVSFCGAEGVVFQARRSDGSIGSVALDPAAACFSALLAIGGDGSDHIVYADTHSHQLKYASDASGSWVVSVIAGADGAEFPSLAVDSGDAIHVAYLVFTGRSPDPYQLDYASNASGAWQTSLVDDVLAYPSIAVDAGGTPHIAYLGTVQPDGGYPVHYSSPASTGWNDQVVATSGDPKTLVALAVAPAGHAGIVYKSQAELDYVTDVSGRWVTARVDSFDAAGPELDAYGSYDVSLDQDMAGKPHLAYEDSSGNLKYASQGASGWDAVYVDTQGAQNQLRMDLAGHAHIAYAGTDNLYSMLAVSP